MPEAITGYPAIDNWLNVYQPDLSACDYARFCGMFRNLLSDEQQLRHKLRELIMGGFLAKHGYEVEYEREYDNPACKRSTSKRSKDNKLTPEWTISKDRKMVAIVEVTNFHGNIEIENEIRSGGEHGSITANGVFHLEIRGQSFAFGYFPSSRNKVWSALEEKFRKYKDLANKLDIPYIVGFAVELVASALIEPNDVLDAVHNAEYGLFEKYPEVSGLYRFADSNGYQMWYEPNPHTVRPLENMPQGSPIRAWD
jgi:hypothetical protein